MLTLKVKHLNRQDKSDEENLGFRNSSRLTYHQLNCVSKIIQLNLSKICNFSLQTTNIIINNIPSRSQLISSHDYQLYLITKSLLIFNFIKPSLHEHPINFNNI